MFLFYFWSAFFLRSLPSFFSFSYKIFCPIRASGLNKSNLSCWERKHWKPLMYFMIISCDREGGGGEQQRVSTLVEVVMVFLHLWSFPKTMTKTNGRNEGTKGWGRGGMAGCRGQSFLKPQVLGVGGGQNCPKYCVLLRGYSVIQYVLSWWLIPSW